MIRIGTRGSALALWQARQVEDALRSIGPTELVVVETSGDRDRATALSSLTSQGFFTKELEDELLAGRVEVAVHSLKDLPTRGPAALELVAVLERGDPRDTLLVRPEAHAPGLGPLPLASGARLATGSNRRRAQVRSVRSDLAIEDLRGNVPTRIRKVREGRHDAALVAEAALVRLAADLEGLVRVPLEVETLVPAPGQAAVAVQMRRGDPRAREVVEAVHDEASWLAVSAERRLMALLEGGCQLPLGAHVRARPGGFQLLAAVAPPPRQGELPDPACPLLALEGADLDELVGRAHEALAPLAGRPGMTRSRGPAPGGSEEET